MVEGRGRERGRPRLPFLSHSMCALTHPACRLIKGFYLLLGLGPKTLVSQEDAGASSKREPAVETDSEAAGPTGGPAQGCQVA